MKKLSKAEANKKIKEFFSEIKNKTPKEIKKIKKLAMRHSIKLSEKRKLFCKKCYSPNLKVKSIKNGIKSIICEDCGYVNRWKVN